MKRSLELTAVDLFSELVALVVLFTTRTLFCKFPISHFLIDTIPCAHSQLGISLFPPANTSLRLFDLVLFAKICLRALRIALRVPIKLMYR